MFDLQNTTSLWSAILIALLSSIHCVAMCGPVASFYNQALLPSQARSKAFVWYKVFYSLGRVSTYMLMGALAALAISPLKLLEGNASHLPRILMGLMLILMALSILLKRKNILFVEKVGGVIWQGSAGFRNRLLPVDSFSKAYLLGLMWGLLPCGVLYSVSLIAGSSGSVPYAVLYMFLFGVVVSLPVAGVAELGSMMVRYKLHIVGALMLLLMGLVAIALPWLMQGLMPEALKPVVHHCLPLA